MKDTIYRADAIKAVHKYFVDALNNEPHEIDEDGDDVFTDMESVNALFHHNKTVSKALKALPSADAVEVVRDTEWVAVRRDEYEDFLASAEAEPTVIRSKTLMPTKDFKEWAKRIREENPNAVIIPCDAEVASAEAKRVLQGYCKGADCKWWNPQVEGCNRCVFVKDEYTHPSAEATCATCGDRAMCIMSAPDGNWKACKDYRPIVAEDLNEAYKRGFEDGRGSYDVELARSGKLFYDEDDYWSDRQAEAVPQSDQYKKGFEDAKRAFELEYARESENMLKRNAELEVMLNAQKAISAEAVQGEWIEKNSHTFICNQCGFEQAIYGTPQGEGYFFCPHCGARMEGGDSECV